MNCRPITFLRSQLAKFCLFMIYKTINCMQCCHIIDHRRCKNVVGTTVIQLAGPRVPPRVPLSQEQVVLTTF